MDNNPKMMVIKPGHPLYEVLRAKVIEQEEEADRQENDGFATSIEDGDSLEFINTVLQRLNNQESIYGEELPVCNEEDCCTDEGLDNVPITIKVFNHEGNNGLDPWGKDTEVFVHPDVAQHIEHLNRQLSDYDSTGKLIDKLLSNSDLDISIRRD